MTRTRAKHLPSVVEEVLSQTRLEHVPHTTRTRSAIHATSSRTRVRHDLDTSRTQARQKQGLTRTPLNHQPNTTRTRIRKLLRLTQTRSLFFRSMTALTRTQTSQNCPLSR